MNELDQLKELWKTQEQKLDDNLQLNKRLLEKVNINGAKSTMRALLYIRIAEALIFLVLVIALFGFIANNLELSAPTISAAVLGLFAMAGLIGSIGQIALISTIDYSGSLLEIQKQLATIRSHNIQLFRLLLLSIPFNMAYIFLGFKVFWGIDLYAVADPIWFIVQIIFSVILLFGSVWLVSVLNPQKPQPSWVKKFVPFSGSGRLTETIELIQEIEGFKETD